MCSRTRVSPFTNKLTKTLLDNYFLTRCAHRTLLNVGLVKTKLNDSNAEFGDDLIKPAPAPSRDEWWGREAGSSMKTRVIGYEGSTLLEKRQSADTGSLIEVQTLNQFLQELKMNASKQHGPEESIAGRKKMVEAGMSESQCREVVTAGLVTMVLHVEARVAAALGEGFYTIGPGGEELMGCIGAQLKDTDSMALHYRHLATQIARQLRSQDLDSVLLNRARGHVVSAQDPVGGGVHCSLGGGVHDHIVTSTLASQTTPAVGRGIGAGLVHQLGIDTPFPKDFVSFVSVGDGSVNNAHFLSGLNMAQYAKFRNFKCPTMFCVTDNDLCISLRGHGWLSKFVEGLSIPLFVADGQDMFDLWNTTASALEKIRKTKQPAFLHVKNIKRRFGHAATDRQLAYMTEEEVNDLAWTNPMASACHSAVYAGVFSYHELHTLLTTLWRKTESAFNHASTEPKLTSRQSLVDRTAQPLVPMPSGAVKMKDHSDNKKGNVMRKNMTRVIDEILTEHVNCVYIGEDVEHGGYYLVTEGLRHKHSHRVRDFPPDETALLGVAQGLAQAGMLPIVEIPYAKYLDCGLDMFTEIAIANWLSNGQQPNGMIVRVQGFDKGVFGGNYHTHNSVHIPPGVDVVCYSNGEDYVRGWRYCIQQAKAGRVVVSVDSTNLLNARHLFDSDDKWKRPYPPKNQYISFDDVVSYGKGTKLGIVSYGNGVPEALRARQELEEMGIVSVEDSCVIDSPYLTHATKGLIAAVSKLDAVVFADVCKQGQHPLAAIVCELQAERCLPKAWQCVAAVPTYNPLGSTLTFTNVQDIVAASKETLSC
eukprot:m.172946 g.172946  ORF g.172946 m.172946 type:complete len:817 (+) comp15379_c0_seq5:135-2585(+)